jgi:integration host factor subunit beta
VTKAHLVDQIADSAQLGKQDCDKIVSSIFAAITKALQDGERIDIRGFGSFKVKDQAARQARNPRTGETVAVPAKKVAAFKPSKEIAELLNPAVRAAEVE